MRVSLTLLVDDMREGEARRGWDEETGGGIGGKVVRDTGFSWLGFPYKFQVYFLISIN